MKDLVQELSCKYFKLICKKNPGLTSKKHTKNINIPCWATSPSTDMKQKQKIVKNLHFNYASLRFNYNKTNNNYHANYYVT